METLIREQSSSDTENGLHKTLFAETFTVEPKKRFTREQEVVANQLADNLQGSRMLIESTIQDSLMGDFLKEKDEPDIQLAAERTLFKIREMRDMYSQEEQQNALLTRALFLEEKAEKVAQKILATPDGVTRESLVRERDELTQLAENFEAVSSANRQTADRLTKLISSAMVLRDGAPVFSGGFITSVESVATQVASDAQRSAVDLKAQWKQDAENVDTNDRNTIVAGAEQHLRKHEISQINTEPTVSVDIDALAVTAAKKAVLTENGTSLYID
ncbi:hypothetical protein KI440_02260 [Candidatus Saccharibacteria bacterium TM7i]|nr:hypothetical protein KI440_02260 [Candidatus Saccharibacteria bacterium TM7i]